MCHRPFPSFSRFWHRAISVGAAEISHVAVCPPIGSIWPIPDRRLLAIKQRERTFKDFPERSLSSDDLFSVC